MSDKPLSLLQKLLKVKESVEFLKKENQGHEGMKYKFVSSSQVLMSIRSTMNQFGILLLPSIKETKVTIYDKTTRSGNENKNFFTEIFMTMTWVNVDDPSEQISSDWYAQGLDADGEKGIGKALTYAEKYFLLKFFNIPTDKEDPDFEQGQDEKPYKQKTQQKTYQKPVKSSGDDEVKLLRLKKLYQDGKGSLDGFEAWKADMDIKKYSLDSMIEKLAQKLNQKSEEQQ
jgi:hypothetical protein